MFRFLKFCMYTFVSWFFFLSLCPWMFLPLSSYIMTHCMCIYFCSSRLFFSFYLNICISLWLYCDSLYVYMYVTVFSYIVTFPSLDPCFSLSLSFSLNTSFSVGLYCHWLYMNRYMSWSAFLSLSVCLNIRYIISNSTCIRTSLGS